MWIFLNQSLNDTIRVVPSSAGAWLGEAVIYIGAISAAIFAAIKLWKYLKPHTQKLKDRLMGLTSIRASQVELTEKVNNMDSKLDKIMAEFRPNGGSTNADKMNLMSQMLTKVMSRQLAFEDINDREISGKFEVDKRGELTWVSRKFCRMTGKNKDELLGNGWINMLSSSHKDSVVEEWEEAISSNRTFLLNFTILDSHNEELKVVGKTEKLLDEKGLTIGFIGTITPTG